MKKSKVLGILVIIASYIIAFGIGAVLHYRINFSNELFLLKLLIIDVAMTIVIFIFSTIFKNSSIYDPYWSVIPIVLSIYASYVLCGFHGMSYIMIGLLCIWGLRLTINFFNTFKGLDKQDWRYDHYKNKFPRIWPLVNFFGIHLFPTLIVYMVMLPVFKYLETCETAELNLSTIIVIIIALVAIVIESIADRQMHKFLKTRKNNEIINVGLWKRSRHPNYFGEILFWWAIYLIMLSLNDNMWVLFLGPLLNTLMFVFISVPLAEKHQLAKNPQYKEYVRTTNTFLLFPKKEVVDK